MAPITLTSGVSDTHVALTNSFIHGRYLYQETFTFCLIPSRGVWVRVSDGLLELYKCRLWSLVL